MKGRPGAGDVWTWTAMDADSKLVISWLVGERNAGYATEFINDLATRLVPLGFNLPQTV
jgi:transposase-like protein